MKSTPVLFSLTTCCAQYVFMDNESYEETRLPKDDWAKYLKEGTTCSLVFWNGKVGGGGFWNVCVALGNGGAEVAVQAAG
jgi:hypothetical protein